MEHALPMLIAALVVAAYGIASKPLERHAITGPMVMTVAGFILGRGGAGVFPPLESSLVRTLAEVTLALVLFSDASRIDPLSLRRQGGMPVRLLLIGLPLTILLGTAVGAAMLPALNLASAALLASILAPTDAALGQATVSDPAVPARVRQTLNVESGLNDGIALPAVLFFAALTAPESAEIAQRDALGWTSFVAGQLLLGPLAGAVAGVLGGRAAEAARKKGWETETYAAVTALAIAALAYTGAEVLGGNGFIAAFVAGLAFGRSAERSSDGFVEEFTESEGQVLILLAFLLFGATLLPDALAEVRPHHVVYALLSLTVIRMLPVAICLIGAGVRAPTALFIGWFGPRGLATILYVVIVTDDYARDPGGTVAVVASLTAGLSILLHGLSASPLSALYGRMMKGEGDEEQRPTEKRPTRTFAKPKEES
ncbi:cation:proton antiporter [Parvularcula dongshanensis]|uniref:NhaP-type Na+/H+ or K+/H+ antiporter n=1 Tax=Parvularcula dongshanensis TaxID=1173995 RepID=A0A840I4S9_9PROT|nr:cation:proton antiporter [Parvularcula dongshanensis]MBB4659178.1 NhaP-type Na+/H+ or K+/H+ antiporter [Parvularcula dongshanensis]